MYVLILQAESSCQALRGLISSRGLSLGLQLALSAFRVRPGGERELPHLRGGDSEAKV